MNEQIKDENKSHAIAMNSLKTKVKSPRNLAAGINWPSAHSIQTLWGGVIYQWFGMKC